MPPAFSPSHIIPSSLTATEMAGKQSRPRKPEIFGKGKVTPTQIAFIVDRYLCDNKFSSTRSTFRTEASSIIAHSPVHEAPKSLLTLGEMLDEYISLKEQKVMMDQEKAMVEQEKHRVQMLLQGMQNVMTAYNASGNLLPPPISNTSRQGVPTSVQNRLKTQSLPSSSNTNIQSGNLTTPMISVSDKKRKDTTDADVPAGAAKRSRGRSTGRKIPTQAQQTLQESDKTVNNQTVAQTSAQVQGSNVAKCLFNQSSHIVPSNSPVPKTPTRANSSQSDTNISPHETSSVAACNASTRCTVISTKRVMVSPAKQMAYIEMRHCISPVKTNSAIKRDHVRSRLDFDSADVPESLNNPLVNEFSTSESEKEMDIFDIDFSNFEGFGTDFSINDMLNELDQLPCEGIGYSCHQTSSLSMDNDSGSPQDCNSVQVIPELSNVSEVLSETEKDMRIVGSDCHTTMKTVTTSITVISSEKNQQQSLD